MMAKTQKRGESSKKDAPQEPQGADQPPAEPTGTTKPALKPDRQNLSFKQERFAQLVASGMKQAEAYRQAYASRAKPKLIHEKASRVMVKVRARVAQIMAPVIAKAQYALADAMREAEEARTLAMGDPKGAAAAVGAVALKSKLNGLLVEDRQNERRPLQDVDDDELDARIKRDAAEAGIALH